MSTKNRYNRIFHRLVNWIAAILLVGGIATGIRFFIFYSNHEETNDAQVEQYVTPILSRIPGFIAQVRFDENQFVHKGDTLVILDRREFASRFDQSTAEVAIASNQENISKQAFETANSEIAVKRAQLLAAISERDRAFQDLNSCLGTCDPPSNHQQRTGA